MKIHGVQYLLISFSLISILLTRVVAVDSDELKRLEDLALLAKNAPPSEKVMRWKSFLVESSDYAERNPTPYIWLRRAIAAVIVNNEAAGKEAAKKLFALNAFSNNDELTTTVKTALIQKGWMSEPFTKEQTIAFLNKELEGQYKISYDDRNGRLTIEWLTWASGYDNHYSYPLFEINFQNVTEITQKGYDFIVSTASRSDFKQRTISVDRRTSKGELLDEDLNATINNDNGNKSAVCPTPSEVQARHAVNALRHLLLIIRAENQNNPFDK